MLKCCYRKYHFLNCPISNGNSVQILQHMHQTIKEKEGYVSGPIITTDIKAIQKKATDRTTKIIEQHFDRSFVSKNMYINQALINYSKDKNLFDKIDLIVNMGA